MIESIAFVLVVGVALLALGWLTRAAIPWARRRRTARLARREQERKRVLP
jgi:hypothetical protein